MPGGSASRNPPDSCLRRYEPGPESGTVFRLRQRPSRQAREVRNEIRKGLRTRNRFRERIPEKTNRQPFSNTGLHRTVRANHSGFGKWKAKQRLFDKCRNGRKLRTAAPKNTVIIRIWINPFPRGGFEAFAFPHVPKSYAQRALAASLLAEGTSRLHNIEFLRRYPFSHPLHRGARCPGTAHRRAHARNRRRPLPQATNSTSASRGFPPGSSPRSHPSATRRSEWWAKDRCCTARSGR